MSKKEISQIISLLLRPEVRANFLHAPALVFGFISATQTMDRPPRQDIDDPKIKVQLSQETPSALKNNGFSQILHNHLEIEQAAEDLDKVDLSAAPSKKKRNTPAMEGQTQTEKKIRNKEASNEVILSLVRRIIPLEVQSRVLQFMELPNILTNLMNGSDIPPNFPQYWEPIIAQHIPQLKGYLRTGKKEEDVPAALRPALSALLQKHMSAYRKWQEEENRRIFLPSFLYTLKMAHERGTLIPALLLTRHWYVTQKYTPRQILIFFGFPFISTNKEYEIGINQLRPNNANVALNIIDFIEKKALWPKDVSAMNFLKWIANAPMTSLLLGKQRFEEQLAFKHKENNYSAFFRAFWIEVGNTAQHNELGIHQEFALTPSPRPPLQEDDIDSE